MKKALPAITLLAYLAALVVCIVNIVTGAEANLTAIIVFLIYVIGVMVLMFFATKFMVKKKLDDYEKQENETPFEGLANTENESKESTNEEKQTVSEVFAEEPAEPEVDVISTEGADEDEDDDKNIIVPLILGANTEDDDDGEVEEDNEDDMYTSAFSKSRYTRTYAARLIQADDELKGYYSTVKNAFMSYKKVTCSVSREHERVRYGRITVGMMKVRGKTLLLYLALDPGQFENTMYVGEDVSEVSKYAATPFLYRVNGPRKANRAVRLITMMAEKLEMTPTAEPANEDYVARFPYESTEALVAKGIIIDNVAEAEKKAEEAKLAAEKAELAAQKAIEEALKAKEHAENVSERSERTIDEIESAEEAKAAKQEASAQN